MDNTKIAWLAGIVDGEGSIGMYVGRSHHKVGQQINYITQLEVANDDTSIIEEVLRVESEICGHEIRIVYDIRDNRKFVHYRTSITKRKDLKLILTAIEPYLIGKKTRAQILLRMLNHHTYGAKYTKAELEVIDILKRTRNDNKTRVDGNTEPSRGNKISQACVETIQAALPLDLGVKIESDLTRKSEINNVNNSDL